MVCMGLPHRTDPVVVRRSPVSGTATQHMWEGVSVVSRGLSACRDTRRRYAVHDPLGRMNLAPVVLRFPPSCRRLTCAHSLAAKLPAARNDRRDLPAPVEMGKHRRPAGAEGDVAIDHHHIALAFQHLTLVLPRQRLHPAPTIGHHANRPFGQFTRMHRKAGQFMAGDGLGQADQRHVMADVVHVQPCAGTIIRHHRDLRCLACGRRRAIGQPRLKGVFAGSVRSLVFWAPASVAGSAKAAAHSRGINRCNMEWALSRFHKFRTGRSGTFAHPYSFLCRRVLKHAATGHQFGLQQGQWPAKCGAQ